MGRAVQLHAGDGAAFLLRTQQQPQGAAAGAQIQYPGIFGQLHKIRQDHGVGTQRKAAAGFPCIFFG